MLERLRNLKPVSNSIAKALRAQMEVRPGEDAVVTENTSNGLKAKEMKVLIVEDEHEMSKSIMQYLRQESYVCEVASTIEQAKEKIMMHDYDCILLDITLPYGNGLAILRKGEGRRKIRGRHYNQVSFHSHPKV